MYGVLLYYMCVQRHTLYLHSIIRKEIVPYICVAPKRFSTKQLRTRPVQGPHSISCNCATSDSSQILKLQNILRQHHVRREPLSKTFKLKVERNSETAVFSIASTSLRSRLRWLSPHFVIRELKQPLRRRREKNKFTVLQT